MPRIIGSYRHVAATTLPAAPSNRLGQRRQPHQRVRHLDTIPWRNRLYRSAQRRTVGKSWTSVTRLMETRTDIMDLGVQESSTYIYQIVALDAGGPSSPAVRPCPSPPSPLRHQSRRHRRQ